MRNPVLEEFGERLVGEWDLTLTDAWFLEPGTVQHGRATVAWFGEGFVTLAADMEGEHIWDFVFARNDAQSRLVALYHDPRPASRLYDVTFADGRWTMLRVDPDMHQRFDAEVAADRIVGHWDASDDEGRTWRKDFDLTFVRV